MIPSYSGSNTVILKFQCCHCQVLKLLCLQSVASTGLRPRLLDSYKREVLHAYGYQHLNSLLQLEKAGLLQSQEEKGGLLRPLEAREARGFSALKRQLQLSVKGVNELVRIVYQIVFSFV